MNGKNGKSESGREWFWFASAVAAGIVTALAVNRLRAQQTELPYAGDLHNQLALELGSAAASSVMLNAQHNYRELLSQAGSQPYRALKTHRDKNILSGLALYQALQVELGDKAKAYEVLDVVYGRVFPAKLGLAVRVLGRLPNPFPVFRRAVKWQMDSNFPEQGWQIEWLEDNEWVIAFNLHSCYYLETLRRYGAEELTPLFCKLDDLMYEPPLDYVSWDRTQTLGRGDSHCDFRWTRTR